MKRLIGLTMAGAFGLILFAGMTTMAAETTKGAYVLDHKMKDIDGKEVNLEKYKGKVVLMVNVASKCGFTPQYTDLEALHEKYADKGLVVAGFPANNFGGQEPGTNAEIKEFCSATFNVKFDMYGKISVVGDDKDELYKELTSKDENGEYGGEIQWNFTKFLVGKDGRVIARYNSRVNPRSDEVIAAIESALAAEPTVAAN